MQPTKRKTPLAVGPFVPAEYQDADIGAIRAMARGDASPHQQQRALKWIIEQAAGTYQQHYYPGQNGERDTAFALGRAFVGQQIVKLTKIPTQSPPKPEEAT